MLLSTLQNVVDSLKSHCQHLNILQLEYWAQCFYDSLLNQWVKLSWWCTSGGIRQSPDCLVFDRHFVILENVNQFVDDAHVDATLNLFLSSCSDIRKYPACFFADSSLWMVDNLMKPLNKSTINHKLGLIVIACQNVANGSKTWNHNGDCLMFKQQNKFLE